MGEICLSVAPILRCQSLTRLEAGVLLLPPGFEVILAIVLLCVKRGADKKHVFLASEVFVYFVLAVLDVLTHTIPTIGTSIDSFRSLDIVIGVGSFIPLFLYTFALYLLTTTQLLPSLPVQYQSIPRYVLLGLIPVIILLNELASFVGITYRSFGGADGAPLALGVGFTNAAAQSALSDITLVVLSIYQATNFCIAFFRLLKVLFHQRAIETTQAEKDLEAHHFRGLGWIAAGIKLGLIETLIGFAPGGFGVTFARRLLRLLSRGLLIIGIVKGIDTVEDFKLYSPNESQRRRKSALRAMITNPRFSTFRHVGGHDFDKSNPFDEKHNSVIKLGSPSWMRRDYVKPVDEERPSAVRKSRLTFTLPSRPSGSRNAAHDSTSSFGSSRHHSEDPFDDVQADAPEFDVNRLPIPRPPKPAVPAQQRVTVHIRPDRLPVLELRRFSNLEFLDLIHDPFRDHTRAYSLPGQFEAPQQQPVGRVSDSFTRLPRYNKQAAPGLPSRPTARQIINRESMQSMQSRRPRPVSIGSYDRPWSTYVESPIAMSDRDSAVSFGQRASTASFEKRASAVSIVESPASGITTFNAIGSPSTIMSWESPGSSTTPHAVPWRRRDRDREVSSITTASQVEAIAKQFPGIPTRQLAVPARRSMLSREVARDEFIAGPASPVPTSTSQPNSAVSQPDPAVVRIPSVKRKPAPLITEGLVEESMKNVEIEQVVDEDVAVHSLPTPMSAPRYYGHSSHLADVPLSPSSDDESFDEIPIVRSASVARRGEGRPLRMKSVSNRSVSSAHRVAIPRDSIKVDLGYIARNSQADEEMGIAN